MNKKVLIIALALVVAFAGSAMAAVSFKFTATMEADSFLFEDGFELTSGADVTISASNKSETEVEGEEEARLNWDFSAGLSTTDFGLGKYKLGLYDQYFDLYFWGGGQLLSFKETPFGLISAHRTAATNRARLIVPVVDVAKFTLDFDPADNLKAFVDAEIEGIDVGLAYALNGWIDDPAHTIGVYGTGSVEGFNLKADAAVKLGDDLGFGVGFGVDTFVVDELEVAGSVKHLNDVWTGDKATTTLKASATYTETEFQVTAEVEQILKEDENENEIILGAKYRMGDAVGYDRLFNRGAGLGYFDLDAPAFGVGVAFKDLAFDGVTVNAASPVVEDMAWVHAKANFKDKDDFGADVEGYILATDKLTLKPFAAYAADGAKITAQLGASYKIGLSDTTLGLTAKKVFAEDEDDGSELLKATITVPF